MSREGGKGNGPFDAIVTISGTLAEVLTEGFRQRPKNPLDWSGAVVFIFGAAFVASYRHKILRSLDVHPPFPWETCWAGSSFLGVASVLFVWGFAPCLAKKRHQKKLSAVGLKNATGQAPKIIGIKNLGGGREKITLDSFGVGMDSYRAKKSHIEAAFGGVVESMGTGRSPRFVEIVSATMPLPSKVMFSDVEGTSPGNATFVVGKSFSGVLKVDLRTLPHLMIAGTTGGGKSVFFKQVLLSLLASTPKIQLYLLDLKKGVEMGVFGTLPNVRVAKTEEEAVAVLECLKDEMDRRFEFLEKNNSKEIVPERDKMDRIIVGVDEASVIYTKTRGKGHKKELAERARELTDDLAKLSRAAAIHLILATQKVTKETIDTKVQENVGGRMCFRMNTLQGSMTVLGNKRAHQLPDIKGRGIWASGADFIEVQTPLLEEEELEERLKSLGESAEGKNKSFHGPMIEFKGATGKINKNNFKGDD